MPRLWEKLAPSGRIEMICTQCEEERYKDFAPRRLVSTYPSRHVCRPCIRAIDAGQVRPDRDAAYWRRWRRRKGPLARAASQNGHKKLRDAVVAYLGGQCVHCSFADARALQVDHVNGGGRAEYRKTTYRAVWRQLLAGKREGDFQLLCANCNWIKRVERGEISPRLDAPEK
jgi:hypothetical protein